MSKFKVGDMVQVVLGGASHWGHHQKIIYIRPDGAEGTKETICDCGGRDCYSNDSSLELIETNKTSMNLKEKFVAAFLSEPEKTFRKAGITNGDGILTDEGQQIFLTWLLKQQGNTFKTEVVDQLAEEKE